MCHPVGEEDTPLATSYWRCLVLSTHGSVGSVYMCHPVGEEDTPLATSY